MNEKQWLSENPGKHKANLFCNQFSFPITKNGSPVNTFDINECVKFKSTDYTTDAVDNYSDHNNDWEMSILQNVDYIMDNAIVHMIPNRQNPNIRSAYIVGYIDKKGMWVGDMGASHTIAGAAVPHKIDAGILEGLPQMLKPGSTVVDFGCGNADYIKFLISRGYKCEAYDGNPSTPEATGGIGKVLDLSEPFDLKKTFDYVISLEVAEHIPKEFEEVYVDNLIRHADNFIITSWAVVGQGGDGHINEQNEEYVLDLYKKKGLKYNEQASLALRSVTTLSWFNNTIYIFSKK